MTARRSKVGFDPDHFAKIDPAGSLSTVDVFRMAHRDRLWGAAESVSGPGSTVEQTARLVDYLPGLLQDLGVGRLLDLPCGDFHWLSRAPLGDITYVGADILPELVAENSARYTTPTREFCELDLTRSPLPDSDLVLCRDCLVHLSIADIHRAIRNLRRSNGTFLLTTTFPSEPSNVDVRTGDWRPLNLELAPFGFPSPLRLFNEACTEQDGSFADKSLGLWRLVDLPATPGHITSV